MNRHHSEALTLRTYSYSEFHKIVVFMTKEFGKVRGIAHGAKRPKNKFGGSLEPLNQVRLGFHRKEHQDLAVVRSCEVIRIFSLESRSWETSVHLSYFTELLLEFSREEEQSEHLFRLALAVLGTVNIVPISLLSRYFELWILKLEGILPDLDHELPPTLAVKVRKFMRKAPVLLKETSVTREDDKTLGRFSEKLLECHLEKPLKTRKLLKEFL